MTHHVWTDTKPDFNEPCLLIAATKIKRSWFYSFFTIELSEGENGKGETISYWAILTEDGDEWGDLADLKADRYMTLEPIK